MIRRFFDPASAEPKADNPAKVEFGGELNINDIYAQMQGNQSQGNQEEKKDDVPPAKTEEKKEEVKEEKKPEEKVEEKKPDASAPPVIDWKELVKKADRKEVLSLLEIDEDAHTFGKTLKGDDFVNKLVTYRKENGNLTPFLTAATKDWDKVSHLDLLRDELRRQHPNLDEKKFEILAKHNIDKRFVLDENTPEEEADLAAVLLETEGEKIRAARKSEQQQFLDSVKPVDKTAEADATAKKQAEENQKHWDEFGKSIDADPFFVQLSKDKTLVIGGKDNAVNYTADPAVIKQFALNPAKFIESFFSSDDVGAFNLKKWAKIVTYAQDPDAFEANMLSKAINKGEGKLAEELENATQKTDQKSTPAKKSLAKAFIEEGQPITLQEMYGG